MDNAARGVVRAPLRYRGRTMPATPEDRPSAEGMGPSPSGPTFVPWTPATRVSDPGVPPPSPRFDLGLAPPRSRLPALVTAAVVFVVVAVVAVASLLAHYADTHVAAPAPVAPAQPVASPTPVDHRVDFVTADGSGELVILDSSWSATGRERPTSGSYLRVQVELVCTDGRVDYDPYHFQAFDNRGQVFDVAAEGSNRQLLAVGMLEAGESVRGTVAFDMARSEATLLMSDGTDQTVTTIRVPD